MENYKKSLNHVERKRKEKEELWETGTVAAVSHQDLS